MFHTTIGCEKHFQFSTFLQQKIKSSFYKRSFETTLFLSFLIENIFEQKRKTPIKYFYCLTKNFLFTMYSIVVIEIKFMLSN